MDAQLYDENGNPMNFGKQAVVNGIPSIHYITLAVRADNTGSTTLTNVRILNSSQSGTELPPQYVNDFTIALQTLVPFASLPRSQTTQWGTGNSCVTNAECGTSEVCIGSTPTCKIPINNYIGEVTFRTSLSADWRDAFNVPQPSVSSNVALSISFLPENVLARFQVVPTSPLNSFIRTWVGYDFNGDGILEAFGGNDGVSLGGVSCVTSGPNFISDYGIYKFQRGVDKIYICKELGATDNSVYFTTADLDRCTDEATCLNELPIEPYTSINCGGIPCQEVYNVQVGQNATCTDGIQNQDETDIDCGGLICGDCANGLHCLINGDCQSNICTAGICTAPAGNQTGFIRFRVPGPLNYRYPYGAICGYDTTNKWMASDYLGNYCTINDLAAFGWDTNTAVSPGNCDSYYGATNKMFQVPYTPGVPDAQCELNGDGDGIMNLYDARVKEGGAYLALCETDADGVGLTKSRFLQNNPNAAPAILNSTPITPANEVLCG